jgi:flavin-dependent dehydrogenase/ferredoxin-like protein FixX
MTLVPYDVVIVGAGCAGLTAAVGLARAGFTVAVLEAAREAGGSGMLGGVCFAESLIQADILGAEEVEALPWEQRLIERGSFVTDGRRLAGYIYRDADAFFPCYTFLRSSFGQKLVEAARAYGVALHTETTVESLIRDGRRIIGAATTRGPFYAHLVFVAEGDAGFLVSREGLDRFSDPRDQPAFLYCLQQVFESPPGAIEEHFRVGAGQGVAYDFLLRNPAMMPLNVRGQLCTHRQGLLLSIVLPASNLQRWFRGEPRQLLDWFADMPALRRWLSDSQRGAWTAALLRTGGLRDVPYLIEDGLAIGGAAAGLGVDFPIMNLTGPAMATGMLLRRAAARIRAEGRGFDRDALARHYLGPLQQTRYWHDMEFAQRWPGYLERTSVLFGHWLDLLLDSASVWARPRRWLPRKFAAWLGVLARVSWRQWNELRDEILQVGRVLRLREVTPRPALARMLLDGALNAFRDLARRPRPHLPRCGTLRLHYHAAEEQGRASAVPWLFRRWFERFRPVLAAVGRIFHANDDSPLSVKLNRIFVLLLRQINLFDLLAVAGLAFPIALASTMLSGWRYIFRRKRKSSEKEGLVGWAESLRPTEGDMVGLEDSAHPTLPHIRIAWRSTQPEQQAESVRDLPHICPARVFEVTGTPPAKVAVAVHAERCIFCQACWRANPLVDWARNGASLLLHRWIVETDAAPPSELNSLLDELERKLQEFDAALGQGPALVDRPHNDYLEMLARYAQQLSYRIREILYSGPDNAGKSRRSIRELAGALAARAEERTRRTWEGRFAWAAADGRLLRQHHLAELRRLLAVPPPVEMALERTPLLRLDWLAAVPSPLREDAGVKHLLAAIAARHYLLGTIETAAAAEPVQAELLVALAADLRDELSVRTQELGSLLDDKMPPFTPRDDPAVPRAYGQYGRCLLDDLEETRKFLDKPGDWQKMAQLRVLRAEYEELAESERRLLALASEWREVHAQPADEEVSAGFGQQATHILAGKMLLLRTFARLERGDDAELAIVLLRVWLDHAAALLAEYALVVRERLRRAVHRGDRPLVEPDSGAPLRTQAEYLAAPATYRSGDFLLAPLDLLGPRLVPEMVGEKEIAVAGPDAAALLRFLKDLKDGYTRHNSRPDSHCSAEAMAVETIGRYAADPSVAFDLEWACTRLILANLRSSGGTLRERCIILRALAGVVVPRLLGGLDTRARHLERDALELEALKADFRQRLEAVWQVFGESLGRNADVQASCFALAEAAAWLKAADSTLGRMAWISRLCQAEDREDPAAQQDRARRALAHCFAEIRDRLFRFDEDLASLRRGYYAPHVYAAALLLRRALFSREP